MNLPASSTHARALWYVGQGLAELRDEALPPVGAGMVRLKTLWSGVSRGTERLVSRGLVPPSEHERMRGPNMGGTFPFPVKYGYCAVGVVEEGPDALIGRHAFALHPHQEQMVLPVAALTLLPETLPARRATLAANMETALNALWDSSAAPGDRIAVVGGGVIGSLIAALAGRLPGADVTLVDPAPARRETAELLGVSYAQPANTPMDCDVVFHASASAAGLATALDAAGFEATVVEVSWFGNKPVAVPLGGAFHSRRLKLVSSQVGHVASVRRARWDYARRMAKAVALLADERLDALIGEEVGFDEAAIRLPALLADDAAGFAPVIRYS
ncbi:MAG: zinc-dependent alcohol dehydrogenase [Beijerinckiaceae bacterium]